MKKIGVSLLLFACPFLAQVRTSVEGEIVSRPGEDASWFMVRLRAPGSGGVFTTAHVNPGGTFTLQDVEAGTYILQVVDAEANEIASQSLSVASGANPPVSIRLPERRVSRPTGETISASRLLHPPDKRAIRAAANAQKFSRSGAYDRAAAELEHAVQYDPSFADAYNNLGVQYLRLGRDAAAAAAFRRAIELDPHGALQQANLAVALARSGQLAEAETRVREAVRLDPANRGARAILETILTARRRGAK